MGDYLPRRNRKEAYRRSDPAVTTPPNTSRKEARSNSDKSNYEENFPDISESKISRVPSEKASSTSYLSDNNNESDHNNTSTTTSRPRQKKETAAKSEANHSAAESEYDRK